MQTGYFHRVQAQTPTKFWINNVTREEAKLALQAGAVGCTQNPSYVWKMLNDKNENQYAEKILDRILKEERDDTEAQIKLQQALDDYRKAYLVNAITPEEYETYGP